MDFEGAIHNLKTRIQTLTGKAGGSAHVPLKESAILKPAIKILGKYSYENENILGVEISPHYIRICQMKNSYDRWILTQLASACMETQFTNIDIQQNPEAYAENLKLLLERHKIKTTDIALSIPTSSSITKIINMPDMEEEDLAGAAAMGGIWESMVRLDGSISEYSVYYKVLRRKIKPSESYASLDGTQSMVSSDSMLGTEAAAVSASGAEINLDNILEGSVSPKYMPVQVGAGAAIEGRTLDSGNEEGDYQATSEDADSMDVLFVAARIADIGLYTSIAQRAGLNPVIVDVKGNALKHAFETNPDKRNIPQPYALLEFGADENYVYIIEGDSIATFNIELSAEDRLLMIRHEENAEALREFTQRYAQQLQLILDGYSHRHVSGHKVYNIYVSSATPLHVDDASSEPLINNFVSYMSELMPTHKISPCTFCNHIEVPLEFAKKVNAEGNLSAWATVVGLATYKLDVFNYNKETSAIDKVNLLPGCETIRKSSALQMLSTVAMAAVLAFVLFLSGASFSMLSIYAGKISSEIKEVEAIKSQYEGKNKELEKLNGIMNKVKSLGTMTSKLPSNQVEILTVYKDITNAIPEGVWLSNVSFTYPKDVEIQGNSINDQNILEFVKKLNESTAIKKVSLKTMAVQEDKTSDKAATAAVASISGIKKFTMQGELVRTAAEEKLEMLSSGAK